MLTPYQLSIFLPAACIVAISPGANNILSLSHGALAGFYPTVFSLAGRFLAFSLMLLPVAAGLGAVITTSEVVFLTIKWIGVCYLAYIGFSMWFSRFHYDPIDTSRGFDGISLAKEEFIVAMTNPKAVLLFTAFLPQFVSPDHPYFRQLLTLGGIYIAVEFLAACIYAASGSILRISSPSRSRSRVVNKIGGAMMLGAAIALAIVRTDDKP